MERFPTYRPSVFATCVTLALLLPAITIADDRPDPTSDSDSDSVSVTTRLQQAADLRQEGYYDRAVESYTAILDEDATCLEATLGIVACHLETGQYAKARQRLETYRKAGKRSARWHLLQAETSLRVGEYDETITFARQALKLDAQLCRARLILASTLELVGKEDDALAQYEWFNRLVTVRLPEDAESLTAAGQGFYRYSVRTRHPNLTRRTQHVLNAIFQEAYEHIDRMYWPARVAAGDLLREKYNLEEAEEDYKQALRINSSAADAHVGLGRIALEHWDFETIERRAGRALEINANHVGAFNLLAAGKIVERRYTNALGICDKALAVNPRDIEALALRAAALFALGRNNEAEQFVQQAESISPRNALLYTILADTFGGLRRFQRAEELYDKAIAVDPSAPRPRIELGLMYMQWGDEAKARSILDTAWKIDPFNERTKYTLDLLDELAAFDTIETEHFTIRFDGESDAITGRYFAKYLESIYDSVCDDYDARLPRRTIIEIFPTHSQFGVRITGKPWIHTIGACTGWVIAMDAPRHGADLQGPYNFANVLRHEFTHTVTLAVTDNRIPHWFTEGLAVFREDAPRNYFWMQLLTEAVRRDELFTLESIDWGFMRPRRATDRQLAYAQSEWMCEYLVERYGYDVLNKMLAGYKAHKTQEQVFVEQTEEPIEMFDKRFAIWAGKQARTWGFDQTPPADVYKLRAWAAVRSQDANVQAKLARAEYDAENRDRALEAARKSVKLDARDNPAGLEILLRVLADLGAEATDNAERAIYDDEAKPHATRLLELDPDNRFALKALSEGTLRHHQYDAAEPLLKRLKVVWPADPFAARSLAGIYLERSDDESALPNLLDVASTNNDDADIPHSIGLIYMRRRQLPDARYWFTQALYIDPLMESAHVRLAETYMQTGETRKAIDEYETLCRIAPGIARYYTACALAYHKLGDAEKARAFAKKAVALDPTSAAATLLDD